MSILIHMEMPRACGECSFEHDSLYLCKITGSCTVESRSQWERMPNCPLIEIPPHGRLGDLDALRRAMYHEAFETDSPMQKWDSGCWIRYKMFERMEEAAPTIIPADPEKEDA